MAAIAKRQQSTAATGANSTTTLTATLPAAPLDGSLIVALFTIRSDADVDITDPGGLWTATGTVHASPNGGYQTIAYAWASGGAPAAIEFVNAANYKRLIVAEFTGVDPVQEPLETSITDRTGTAISPDLLPAQDGDLAILGLLGARGVGAVSMDTDDADWNEVDQGQVGGGFMPRGALYWREVAGDDVDGASHMSTSASHGARMLTWRALDNVPTGGEGEPGEPPSTLPEHELDPGAAILEVYTIDPTAPIWDVALWDDSYAWGEGGWRDVTPEGITADIHWGSDQAHLGILAPTRAAVWTVTTFDPDRRLDPSNPDSDLYPEVVPFLPIRLRHRSAVVRTGYCERISYSFATRQGMIRATDNIARMAATNVPADQVPFFNTTLLARCRDAIAAAGLDIDVPHEGSPLTLSELEDGDYTVWDVVTISALEVLRIPYLDKDGRLRFRSYQSPPDRGLRLEAPSLVDLGVEISHDGLYSAVRVTDGSDADTVKLLAVTPTPVYGTRVYERSERTIEGEAWAEAVLNDRAAPAVRLVPGQVRPLNTAEVEALAKVEIGEQVSIGHAFTDPVLEASGLILGERVRVESHGPAKVDWQWWFDTASAGVGPLLADYLGDLPPREWLVDDDSGEYLYPDGVIGVEEV